MCIVLDTNVIRAVFNKSDAKHQLYACIHKWLFNGSGKMVYGGTTYRREVMGMSEVIGALLELNRQRKAVKINDAAVDDFESTFKTMESSADFDDPHLIAIFRVSRCRLLCSEDHAAGKYVRQKRFYLPGHPTPKIYKKPSHRSLLCAANIAPCCRDD